MEFTWSSETGSIRSAVWVGHGLFTVTPGAKVFSTQRGGHEGFRIDVFEGRALPPLPLDLPDLQCSFRALPPKPVFVFFLVATGALAPKHTSESVERCRHRGPLGLQRNPRAGGSRCEHLLPDGTDTS
jgi:hypothetical protein